MVSRSHDRPASACFIAQQYSSVTFASMGFNLCKKKFGARFKMLFQCLNF
jgi:hypothetical protein